MSVAVVRSRTVPRAVAGLSHRVDLLTVDPGVPNRPPVAAGPSALPVVAAVTICRVNGTLAPGRLSGKNGSYLWCSTLLGVCCVVVWSSVLVFGLRASWIGWPSVWTRACVIDWRRKTVSTSPTGRSRALMMSSLVPGVDTCL